MLQNLLGEPEQNTDAWRRDIRSPVSMAITVFDQAKAA
jgi:hypothetical protein